MAKGINLDHFYWCLDYSSKLEALKRFSFTKRYIKPFSETLELLQSHPE
ncbi:hypothetical protein VCHA34P116_10893 [Vibrio chagasii]|nr:hypothetical protein VCHA35O137_10234 [Vibrio chagasii]CAH6857472.1 hypothetical protein VCHA32P90_10892 [Vibrio chagasii]CAH6862239.1 hypothetical protein VCHA34P116_10893 [Vibrio chagasii]CAH7028700.1 hypothetical protein VCHA39P230_10234 [Vibrio chagasii]